jgi:hypothetical protein
MAARQRIYLNRVVAALHEILAALEHRVAGDILTGGVNGGPSWFTVPS